MTTGGFGAAVVKAAESAYSAIARPVEGTILTVIRDWARHVADRAQEIQDFGVLLPESLKAAKVSLENTPKQMKALQKAGVVDAGAQGFVYLLEGIVTYFRESARHAPEMTAPEDIRAAVFDKTPEDDPVPLLHGGRCSRATRSTATACGARWPCSETRS